MGIFGRSLVGLMALVMLLGGLCTDAGAQTPQAVAELYLAKEIYSLEGSAGPQKKIIPVQISAEGLWGPLPEDSWVLDHYMSEYPAASELGGGLGQDPGPYIFLSGYQKAGVPVKLQIHLPALDRMGLVESGSEAERKYQSITSAKVDFAIKAYSAKSKDDPKKLLGFKLDPDKGTVSWTPMSMGKNGAPLAPVVLEVLVTFQASFGVNMNGVSLPGFDKQETFTRRVARLILPICGGVLNNRSLRCPGPPDPAITWQAKQIGPLGIAIPSHWKEKITSNHKSAFWSLGATQPPEAGVFVLLAGSEPDLIGDLVEVKKNLISISGHLADSYTGWSPGKKARATFIVFRNRHEGLVLTAGFVSTSWKEYQPIFEAIRGSLKVNSAPALPKVAAGLPGPDIGLLKAPAPAPVETVSDTALSFPDESQPPAAEPKQPKQTEPAEDSVLAFPDESPATPAPAPVKEPQKAAEAKPAPAPAPAAPKPVAPPKPAAAKATPVAAPKAAAPKPEQPVAAKAQKQPSPPVPAAPAVPPAPPAAALKVQTPKPAEPALVEEKNLEEGPAAKQPAKRALTREEQEILAYELFRKLSKTPPADLETIEKLYQEVMDKCPLTERAQIAYWQLSNLYLQGYEQPQWEKTVDLLERFLEKYPDSPGVPPVTQRLIQAYEESGSWCNAAALYGKTVPELKADREQVRAVYSQYANALFQCGQNEHAKLWYQKVVELDPEGTSLEARAAMEQLEYLAKHAAAEAGADQSAPWMTTESAASAPWLDTAKQAPEKGPAKPKESAKAPQPAKTEKAKPEPVKKDGPETIEFFKPEVPTPLKMSLHVFKPVVFLGEKLRFAARVQGGVPPYTFTWNKNYTRTIEEKQHNVNMPTKIPGKGPVLVEVVDAVGQTASARIMVEVKHKDMEDTPIFQPAESKPKPKPAEPVKVVEKPKAPEAKPVKPAEPVKVVEKPKAPEAKPVKPAEPMKAVEKPKVPEAKPVKPVEPVKVVEKPKPPEAKPVKPAEPVKAVEKPKPPEAKPVKPAEPVKAVEKPKASRGEAR